MNDARVDGKKILGAFLLLLVLVAGVVFTVSSVPAVPYNVRELFIGSNRFLTVFLFSAVLYLVFSGPLLTAFHVVQRKKKGPVIFPAALVAAAAVSFLLLRLSVPLESMHDVVGSPVLGWPWEWELLLRFIALAAGPWTIFFLSSLFLLAVVSGATISGRLLAAILLEAVLALCLSWLFTVPGAATDNLTELLAWNGSPLAGFCLGSGLLFVGLAVGCIARDIAVRRPRIIFVSAVVVFSGFGAYLLFSLGLEGEVHKYGSTFAALQFLLSPGRDALVSGWALAFRYFLLHCCLLFIVVLCQYPVWVWAEKVKKPVSR